MKKDIIDSNNDRFLNWFKEQHVSYCSTTNGTGKCITVGLDGWIRIWKCPFYAIEDKYLLRKTQIFSVAQRVYNRYDERAGK